MLENQHNCIICQEIIKENFMETKDYFNCECQDKFFHTSCFVNFLKSPTHNNCPTCRKQFLITTVIIPVSTATNRQISATIGFLNFITSILFFIIGFKNGNVTGWFGIFFVLKTALYITSDLVSFHSATKFVFCVCQIVLFIMEFDKLDIFQSFSLGMMLGIDLVVR